jgi:RNA polymerase sigma factor (sigma-70 family)
MTTDDDGFVEFARARTRPLLRTAWLLTGDWHLAQDLVQETLARMFQTWHRVPTGRLALAEAPSAGIDKPDAYAHTVLVRTYLALRRRRSFFERPSAVLDDRPTPPDQTDLRIVLVAALGQLSPGDRAVLVLRFLCDRSVEQVADDLGRRPTAIRSMTKRALERLRTHLGAEQVAELELETVNL